MIVFVFFFILSDWSSENFRDLSASFRDDFSSEPEALEICFKLPHFLKYLAAINLLNCCSLIDFSCFFSNFWCFCVIFPTLEKHVIRELLPLLLSWCEFVMSNVMINILREHFAFWRV